MDSLSGGQQQLVLLAQRLSRAPRLLVLDEPTSALDLHHQLEVLSHLRHHADTSGTLVLAALHDLSLAGRFADSLVLINRGRIEASGPAGEVFGGGRLDPVYRIETELLTSRDRHAVVIPHRRSADRR
jgi:iron complex transport system ATP-binding protein